MVTRPSADTARQLGGASCVACRRQEKMFTLSQDVPRGTNSPADRSTPALGTKHTANEKSSKTRSMLNQHHLSMKSCKEKLLQHGREPRSARKYQKSRTTLAGSAAGAAEDPHAPARARRHRREPANFCGPPWSRRDPGWVRPCERARKAQTAVLCQKVLSEQPAPHPSHRRLHTDAGDSRSVTGRTAPSVTLRFSVVPAASLSL